MTKVRPVDGGPCELALVRGSNGALGDTWHSMYSGWADCYSDGNPEPHSNADGYTRANAHSHP